MINKRGIFILCLLLFIISLNSISATTDALDSTDNNNFQYAAENSISTENNVYIDSNSHNIIEDGSKDYPYKSLNNENLEKISANSTIYVAGGTYDLKSTVINKNLSIIGEDKENVIFNPTSSSSAIILEKESSLTLKNFTLQNFVSDKNAAITNYGNLLIDNLVLSNNVGTTSDNMGGSILNNGNLEIRNSLFEKNTASFGAAIYSTANTTIYNTTFDDNNIYNVGGAIYSSRGNLSVFCSTFTKNRAVSGAAIYSAFGYLYVNDTLFYENDAEHFFGGSIYSTGTAIVNNSIFSSNHAKIDGGAITNTHNMTIVNCVFEENWANQNGGVIENVPWTENENGNILVLNSSFKYNYALNNGGVIINYNKPENKNENPCITIKDSVFEYNYAKRGALIYNEEFIDLQYNVFLDNYDDENKMIYSDAGNVISINNNWWGTNTPSADEIGLTPETWLILKFSEDSKLISHADNDIVLTLNTLNTGERINKNIPSRTATFSADNTIFEENDYNLKGSLNVTIYSLGDDIEVQVDNQKLTLQPLNKATIQVKHIDTLKYNDILNINGNLTDENNNLFDNQTIIIEINGNKTETITQNGLFNYSTTVKTIGTHNLTINLANNKNYGATEYKTTFYVQKKPVLYFYDINNPESNTKTTISGKLLNNNKKINNAVITLNVNGEIKTLTPNNDGYFSYNFVTKEGTNNITATYEGNTEYAKTVTSTSFNTKKKTILYFHTINDTTYGKTIQITGKLLNNGKGVPGSKIVLNLNGENRTITPGPSGYFSFNYTINQQNNNITATYIGNDEYSKTNTSLSFIAKKKKTVIYFHNMNDTRYGNKILISGKLLSNGEPVTYSEIKLDLNGENKTLTTNYEGYFKYIFNTIEGTYTVSATYPGNMEYSSSSVQTTFTTKYNISFYYYNITDANTNNLTRLRGKLLNNGEGFENQIVTITINNENYTFTTNKDGYFETYKYLLNVGVNNLTFTYNGYGDTPLIFNTTFMVKKHTRLNLYDVINLGNNSILISGKLVIKEQNNSTGFSNQTVQITVHDTPEYKINLTTNKEGYFSFKYNLKNKSNIFYKVEYEENSIYQGNVQNIRLPEILFG